MESLIILKKKENTKLYIDIVSDQVEIDFIEEGKQRKERERGRRI